MPLYEYQCLACTSISEIHHKLSAPAPVECPKCGSGPLNKLISRTNFTLKGGGWYNDGYGGKSNVAPAKSNDKPDLKPTEKTETGPDKATAPAKTEPPKATAGATAHACSSGGCANH